MCQRLLSVGYALTVWNRSPEKCAPLVTKGATQAHTVKELVTGCDIILLCVSDTAAVESVALADEGIIASLTQGKIVVDFSSIDAQTTQQLATLTAQKNAHWIDAPVSGGVVGAEAGTLVTMAGGNADIIDELRPLLSALSQRVTHMGGHGAGQVTKLCNQLIVAANAVLIAEAVALAQQSGVDATKLTAALAGGFADSKPFQLLAPRMSQHQFEPVQWRVKTLLKDLDNAVAQARSLNLETPLAAHAADRLREHGAHGHLEADLSSIIQLFSHS